MSARTQVHGGGELESWPEDEVSRITMAPYNMPLQGSLNSGVAAVSAP
jgi:hypothetical protein